ncbi:hypothetical protein KKF84_19570 [Myxococcota bacterium]|nr:hypothetical protein [Myxococcota bacterium]MBU1537523.1 hypothetical protein [Myxococcota bacterium]
MKYLAFTLICLVVGAVAPGSTMAQTKMPVYASTYKSAKEYYEKKEYTMARALFMEVRRYAKRDGTYGHIIDYRIGLCYEGEGNNAKAVEHYTIYLQATSIPAKWPSKESVKAKIAQLQKTTVTTPNNTVKDKIAAVRKELIQKILFADKKIKSGDYRSGAILYKEIRRKAIQYRLHTPFLDYQIGYCLALDKNYKQAIYWFNKYVYTTKPLRSSWPTKAKVRVYIAQLKALVAKVEATTNYNTSDVRYQQMVQLYKEGYALAARGQYLQAVIKFKARKRLEIKLNYYNHLIDYSIGYCYDRLNKINLAVNYYKIYLKAPAVKTGWPSIHSVATRIRELSGDADRQNLFNSGNNAPPTATDNPYSGTGYNTTGNTAPPHGTDPGYGGGNGPVDEPGTIFGLKWYWWIAIGVGAVILIAIVQQGSGTESGTTYKSHFRKLTPGGIPAFNNGTGGGVNVIRF